MVCIYCGGPTRVTNSRLQRVCNNIWRRRSCSNCGTVFTTQERPTLETSLVVKRYVGTKQQIAPFNRDRLFLCIYRTFCHRASPTEDASAITRTAIARILKQQQDGSIESAAIATIVWRILQNFDTTSAVIYSAHHPPSHIDTRISGSRKG